jgi:hypothetical protein
MDSGSFRPSRWAGSRSCSRSARAGGFGKLPAMGLSVALALGFLIVTILARPPLEWFVLVPSLVDLLPPDTSLCRR